MATGAKVSVNGAGASGMADGERHSPQEPAGSAEALGARRGPMVRRQRHQGVELNAAHSDGAVADGLAHRRVEALGAAEGSRSRAGRVRGVGPGERRPRGKAVVLLP